MGVSFEHAVNNLQAAVDRLFGADPRVRAVGITRHEDGFGYRAVRSTAVLLPFGSGAAPVEQVMGTPVTFADVPAEVEALVMVAASGPASPSAASLVPEVNRHRPLVAGLQIQNFDDDVRQNVVEGGFIVVGTLGCFVRLAHGAAALLSNNHVVAGENRGRRGSDRILQPGSAVLEDADQIAVLDSFVELRASPEEALPAAGDVTFNDVDAGIASLAANIPFTQGYLPFRELVAPRGVATAQLGDQVFKVGRTTGLTHGVITSISVVVGPVLYDNGPCWFRNSIEIEGQNGALFSDKGDSGSAIVRSNGDVVGLLYAGNGQQTYACPIDAALEALNCTLVS